MSGKLNRRVSGKLPMVFLLAVVACSPPAPKVSPPAPPPKPLFPPQEAMQSGNYTSFLSENQKALVQCRDDSQCAVALFNLGFVYSYPQSPHYSPSKGLFYFEALASKYPRDPLAFQAKAMAELVKRSMASESTKQRLKGQLKSKEAAIKELQKQVEQSKETDMEIERIEKDLQKQIDRSRQIDVEIDRKERELLH